MAWKLLINSGDMRNGPTTWIVREFLGKIIPTLIVAALLFGTSGCALDAEEKAAGYRNNPYYDSEDNPVAGGFDVESLSSSPFAGYSSGDHFECEFFTTTDALATTRVDRLPIPVFLAFFSEEEEATVIEGIEIANRAVGFDVFEVIDEWSQDARPIYKVSTVEFEDGSNACRTAAAITKGYTYYRSLNINRKRHAGRVVVDWAIELNKGSVTKWLVAHELGHAMGIAEHAFINYETDALEELEPNSVMGAVIGNNPELSEYEEMMFEQGQILLDYME